MLGYLVTKEALLVRVVCDGIFMTKEALLVRVACVGVFSDKGGITCESSLCWGI